MVDVHAHGAVAVAAEVLEAVEAEKQGDQGDVARVHGLEGHPRRRAVEVGVRHQLLHSLQHLLQEAPMNQTQLQHP